MTDQELRELDAFCAERVMGWTKKGFSRLDQDESVHRPGNDFEALSPDGNFQSIPFYHRDDAAAMEVLRKCASDGHTIEIWLADEWVVQQRRSHKPGDFIEAEAPTLPLAICLFAKQLYREQKGEG